jgi:hypothetical protein
VSDYIDQAESALGWSNPLTWGPRIVSKGIAKIAAASGDGVVAQTIGGLAKANDAALAGLNPISITKGVIGAGQNAVNVYEQQKDAGENPVVSAAVAAGKAGADLTGVSDLEAAYEGSDAQKPGDSLPTSQRIIRGVQGTGKVAATIVGGVQATRCLAGAGKNCFPAGTPVHTAEGVKAIEQIAVGDRVWAYNHQELRWTQREVLDLFQETHWGTMAAVQIKEETLHATGGHPFWVVRGEGLAARPVPGRIDPFEVDGRQQGRWVLARDLLSLDANYLEDILHV